MEEKRGGGYFANVNGKDMDVKDLDTVCDNLKELFDRQQYTNKKLQEQLIALKDEKWKDAQLQEMKAELEKAKQTTYKSFSISKVRFDAIGGWQRQHDITQHHNLRGYHGVSGGGYTYKFCPTAIGTSGTCVCGSCDAKARVVALQSGNWEDYNKYMEEHYAIFEFQKLG